MDNAIILSTEEFLELAKDASLAEWLNNKDTFHFPAGKLAAAVAIVITNDIIPFATTRFGRLFWGIYMEGQEKL